MTSILLEAAENAAATTGAGFGQYTTIIMLVVLIAVFYFFMYRPQKKQEKETAQMRNNLQVGDEITTIGGIIGRVVSIKDPTVTIVTGTEKTKIRIHKSAVSKIDVKADEAE